MVNIPWWQWRVLERVGKLLGVKLGRAHYYTTILVPRAIDAMLDDLKTHPEHGAAIRAICDEEVAHTARGRRHRILGMVPAGPTAHINLAYLVGHDAADVLYEFARLNRRDEFEAMLRAITDASTFQVDGVWPRIRTRLMRSPKERMKATP